MHYPISCGAHKLTLRRRDLKIDRSEQVTVAPGHELKQHYELGDELRRVIRCPHRGRPADRQSWNATPTFRSTLTVKFGTPTSPPISATSPTASATRY